MPEPTLTDVGRAYNAWLSAVGAAVGAKYVLDHAMPRDRPAAYRAFRAKVGTAYVLLRRFELVWTEWKHRMHAENEELVKDLTKREQDMKQRLRELQLTLERADQELLQQRRGPEIETGIAFDIL